MTVMHKDLTGGNLHILFRTGTADERDLVTPRPGDGWLETDTGKIFVCYVSGTWKQQGQVDGDLKAKFTDIENAVTKTHEHNKPMLGMQWREVVISTDVGAWLCGVFIPEAHRWLFGAGIYNEEIEDYEGAVLYSDNLVNFKVAKTFADSDQVKSLLVVRFVDKSGNRIVRVIAGVGKAFGFPEPHPATIWTSDDYGMSWTFRADFTTFGSGTEGTEASNELLELKDGTILAFTRGSAYKVFMSTDHGYTWDKYTQLQGCQQIYAVDYDSEHNMVGMGTLGGEKRGFHYSTDGCAKIETGYLTDGDNGRVNKSGVHSVCYDPVNKKWFFGTPGDSAHAYLFRADYTDLKAWTEVKQFGGLPASEDYATVLKLHYVVPWGRMFIFTCCGEAIEGQVSDYTEIWSTTDGGCAVAGDMKIYREWDSYVPRRLKTMYGANKRRSIRELCAHVFGDEKFVCGAAEDSVTGVRIFVKAHHIKPIISYYAQDLYTKADLQPPGRGKISYFPVLRFDDGSHVADEKAWIKGFSLNKFDLSKPIRIRLEYCMVDNKGAEPANEYIRVELSWVIVHRDEDMSPGAVTGSSAKSIQVSDTSKIFEQYDEFYIPEDAARFPSDICALQIMRDSDHADDLRNGDWCLFAIHFFQDV